MAFPCTTPTLLWRPVVLALCVASLGVQQSPQRLTAPGVSPAVHGVLAVPVAPGTHAAVILLPGSGGWRPIYADLGRLLSAQGFVALALDYHAETGLSSAGDPDSVHKRAQWQQTVRCAVAYLRGLPSVGERPVALVGFSSGAFLAVSVAASTPSVKAVASYFGGGGTFGQPLEKEAKRFPPLLIIHGENDVVVPVARAKELHDAVVKQGGKVEMHLYAGAGHGFTAPGSPGYSKETSEETTKLLLAFLHRWLD